MKSLLLFCALLLSLSIIAQERNRIFGKAVQRSNGAPIPNASIFISGSSLGTMTDAAGNFELNGVPSGNFQLIISSIGFTTIVYPFSTENLPLRLNVQMDEKAEELSEVTVEPFDPDGWHNWGNLFTQLFIGTSKAASQCRIINNKALRFRYNKSKRLLTVLADEPLIIENFYLGYTVKYQLEEFNYDQDDRVITFYGYPFFTDKQEKRGGTPPRYIQRREEVYNGSINHFMWALYNDRLSEEGFEVRRMAHETNYEKERIKKIMASEARRNISSGGVTVMRLGVAPPADSMNYYRQVMKQPDELKRIGADLLRADSLLLPGKDSTKQLLFPHYLQVVYKNGREEKKYLLSTRQSRKAGFPVSEIFLVDESGIFIYPNGYYFPPRAIFALEYWAWSEKISHLLPLGYAPPSRKN